MQVSALNKRRWRNFRANKRAYWSLIIFSICFLLSLFAELIANDKPLIVSYSGHLHFPALRHMVGDAGGFLKRNSAESSPPRRNIGTSLLRN